LSVYDLRNATSAEQLDKKNYQRDYQQQLHKSGANLTDQAEYPEDKQTK